MNDLWIVWVGEGASHEQGLGLGVRLVLLAQWFSLDPEVNEEVLLLSNLRCAELTEKLPQCNIMSNFLHLVHWLEQVWGYCICTLGVHPVEPILGEVAVNEFLPDCAPLPHHDEEVISMQIIEVVSVRNLSKLLEALRDVLGLQALGVPQLISPCLHKGFCIFIGLARHLNQEVK